jgi:hypothetical protein
MGDSRFEKSVIDPSASSTVPPFVAVIDQQLKSYDIARLTDSGCSSDFEANQRPGQQCVFAPSKPMRFRTCFPAFCSIIEKACFQMKSFGPSIYGRVSCAGISVGIRGCNWHLVPCAMKNVSAKSSDTKVGHFNPIRLADTEGGEDPYFDAGAPVPGYGFYSTQGRRCHNEDRTCCFTYMNG